MTALYFFDDDRARLLEPFALTRPSCELRVGALLTRERWCHALGGAAGGLVVAEALHDFEEPGAPPVVTGQIPAGSIVINGRCAVALERIDARAGAWMCDGRLAAVRLEQPLGVEALVGAGSLESAVRQRITAVDVGGVWIDEVWDLVAELPALLRHDIGELGLRDWRLRGEAAAMIGSHPVFVEGVVTIEPHVCFDTSAGPVLLRRGAHIQAFSRIAGPAVIGEGTTVVGARLSCCAIGERCKVGGEISNTVFLGHANKAHDGFVGHSYLGRWVNLGAGTTTSNLKNTYGTVTLRDSRGERPTGMQFLGTLFGDHVKTGIGLRLTTASLIGAGSNLVDRMPPRYVPPFSWGSGPDYDRYAIEKFLVVAERMMARRDVPLTPRARRQLTAAHRNGSAPAGTVAR